MIDAYLLVFCFLNVCGRYRFWHWSWRWSFFGNIYISHHSLLNKKYTNTCILTDIQILCAQKSNAHEVIGVEINEERASAAANEIQALGLHPRASMICGNALEQDYSSGTCFYLYLVPRGLRIILPLLRAAANGKFIRIITYMSPFEDAEIKPVSVFKCSTAQHEEAQWPLFLYYINPPNS